MFWRSQPRNSNSWLGGSATIYHASIGEVQLRIWENVLKRRCERRLTLRVLDFAGQSGIPDDSSSISEQFASHLCVCIEMG